MTTIDRFALPPFSGRLGSYLAVGLLQGLLLAVLQRAAYQRSESWYEAILLALAMAVVFVGVGWQLLSGRDDRPVPYLGLAALAAGAAAMTALVVATQITNSPSSWFVSLFVIGFVGMVALQCQALPGIRLIRADYAEVAAYAWHHALLLALAGAVTGLFFMFVEISASLFDQIGIDMVRAIVASDFFTYPASSAAVAAGVWLGRRNSNVIASVRVFAFAVCRGLLPLAAVVVLGFTATVLNQGMAVLWQTGRPTPILLTLIIFLGVMLNGVYEDGRTVPPYPVWLRRVVEASLVAAVLLAAIACYSLALRIRQYGLMPDRFLGMIVAGFALLYTMCAAWAVFRPGKTWLPPLGRSNIANALLVCLVAVVIRTPWFNPEQVSAQDQLQRVLSGSAHRDTDALYALKSQIGGAGERAYEQAKAEAAGTALPEARRTALLAAIQRVEQPDFYPAVEDDDPDRPEKNYRIDWIGEPLADVSQFDPAELDEAYCGDDACVALSVDLDGDGQKEVLLTSSQNAYYAADIYTRTPEGRYKYAGRMMIDRESSQDKSLVDLFKAGEITTFERKYRSVDLGGTVLHPQGNNRR